MEKGYFETGTEEIVMAAAVGTRGALYHHFADKRALFLAVIREVQDAIGTAVAARIAGGDPLDRLTSGLSAFLDLAAQRGEVQRILLIEGPVVLGWEVWRSLEAEYGLNSLEAMLRAGVDARVVHEQPLRPLAHLLLALVDEAALYIANFPDQEEARVEMGNAIERLLVGLRRPPSALD